jgi:hypothetical protein
MNGAGLIKILYRAEICLDIGKNKILPSETHQLLIQEQNQANLALLEALKAKPEAKLQTSIVPIQQPSGFDDPRWKNPWRKK